MVESVGEGAWRIMDDKELHLPCGCNRRPRAMGRMAVGRILTLPPIWWGETVEPLDRLKFSGRARE